MRLMLHIFRKDARRFWWEIAVTLGLLASVARMDATRVGFIPGAMEGWLNLILPAVWAYLIALVIHDEALVGNRQFWLTRPYPWPALLAAKALFVLVFIHLFSFAAASHCKGSLNSKLRSRATALPAGDAAYPSVSPVPGIVIFHESIFFPLAARSRRRARSVCLASDKDSKLTTMTNSPSGTPLIKSSRP